MSVKFKVTERINLQKRNEPKKHYAIIATDGEISFKQISKRISTMSTVNEGDVLAVLSLMTQVMQEEFQNGRIIRMGDFGSFALTLSSEGKDKADEVTAQSVKSAKIQFRPGKDLKDTLKTLTFEKKA